MSRRAVVGDFEGRLTVFDLTTSGVVHALSLEGRPVLALDADWDGGLVRGVAMQGGWGWGWGWGGEEKQG